MPNLGNWVACAVLIAGCSGRTELAGEGAPGKSPASPAAPPAVTTSSDERKHVLLVVELEPGTQRATTLSSEVVALPLPKRRVPESGPWRVEVLSKAGAVLYSAELPDAAALRAELPNDQGQLTAVNTRKSKAALTLRLPVLADAATVRIVDASAAQASSAGTELGRVAYPTVTP